MRSIILLCFISLSLASPRQPDANESFNTSKKIALFQVYATHNRTFYCQAKFNQQKKITDSNGFSATKYLKRQSRIEWEHIVPAENFGRTFIEWREGAPACVSKKGRSYKGRGCATKASQEYRIMQADLYNLVPAIGAVNAMRSNYNFRLLSTGSSMGACNMIVQSRKVQPPKYTRGFIARTYLYMQATYSRYKMSKQQNQLMNAWNKQYPPTTWECQRASKIKSIQKNTNDFVENAC